MSYYPLSQSLMDFLESSSNDQKIRCYEEIFQNIVELNKTPEILNKIDPSYLETELLKYLGDLFGDDTLTYMDTKLKLVLIDMFKLNGITINEEIALFQIADVLEQYVTIFNLDKGLSECVLNIVDEVEGGENPTFTFIKLVNEYSAIGIADLCDIIHKVEIDVLYNIKRKYEETEDEIKLSGLYIKNLAWFNIRYKSSLISHLPLLHDIKKNQLFNKPFESIFPFINKYILKDEIGYLEYVTILCVGFISSQEGYNNLDSCIEVLDSYQLLVDENNLSSKEKIIKDLKLKLVELKK